jgi:hypothetical protein
MSIGSTTIPMASTVYIGASVTSARYGAWATATFDNVSVVSGCSSVILSQTSFYSGVVESDWPVDVTAPDDSCTWNVTSDSSWLVVTSTPPAPAGSGSIWVHTDTNTGGFRVGQFTIAGVAYTVSQDGAM